MNSREIVKRTVEFGYPERLATTFPAPYGSDIMSTGYEMPSMERSVARRRRGLATVGGWLGEHLGASGSHQQGRGGTRRAAGLGRPGLAAPARPGEPGLLWPCS